MNDSNKTVLIVKGAPLGNQNARGSHRRKDGEEAAYNREPQPKHFEKDMRAAADKAGLERIINKKYAAERFVRGETLYRAGRYVDPSYVLPGKETNEQYPRPMTMGHEMNLARAKETYYDKYSPTSTPEDIFNDHVRTYSLFDNTEEGPSVWYVKKKPAI